MNAPPESKNPEIDIDAAIAEHLSALERQGENDQVYYNLGVLYEQTGRLDEAADSYSKAIEANPNDAKIHNNLKLFQVFRLPCGGL